VLHKISPAFLTKFCKGQSNFVKLSRNFEQGKFDGHLNISIIYSYGGSSPTIQFVSGAIFLNLQNKLFKQDKSLFRPEGKYFVIGGVSRRRYCTT
jgi:hypothetical protein